MIDTKQKIAFETTKRRTVQSTRQEVASAALDLGTICLQGSDANHYTVL